MKNQNAKISEQQVVNAAQLARISLTPQEVKKYQKELSSILDFVEKLNEVDVAGAEPTIHAVPLFNVTRPDQVFAFENPERLIDEAPRRRGRFIKVKSVFE